jgi:hypothetical protein
MVVYVGPLQLLGYLLEGAEQKGQCWDESAVGGDVDSSNSVGASGERRPESR